MLAHEFGHYSGGDTKLGPWIYRTRETIVRTVAQLSDEDGDESWSQKARPPAVHLVRARVPADHRRDLAPAGVRRRRLRGAQRRSRRPRRGARAHPRLRARLRLLLGRRSSSRSCSSGRRPPLADGFRRFIAHESIERQRRRAISPSCATPRPTRTTRTRRCPSGSPPSPACPTARRTTRPCAIEVLADAERVEHELLRLAVGNQARELPADPLGGRGPRGLRRAGAQVDRAVPRGARGRDARRTARSVRHGPGARRTADRARSRASVRARRGRARRRCAAGARGRRLDARGRAGGTDHGPARRRGDRAARARRRTWRPAS